jgi:hypothetical protein
VFSILPPGAQAYGAIDGKHLKTYVNDITALARKDRDRGGQYWGRIVGTQGHQDAQDWVEARFRQIGLDVRKQEVSIAPDWFPMSWELSASGGGKTVKFSTASPIMDSPGTPAAGLDLETVWVGSGLAPDFMGKDVRGKAAVLYSVVVPGVHSAAWTGGMRRAQDAGAAAIVVIFAVPGDATAIVRPEGMGRGGKAPLLTVGLKDGMALQELIATAAAGAAPKIHLKLDVKTRQDLKSTMVMGVLPGQTDENIVVSAHTDAYFEGAQDNASGMATMIGLAEYYAKVPKEKRRRTMTFIASPEHHSGSSAMGWFHNNMKPFLAKTALVINCEHTATSTLIYWMEGQNVALHKSNGREQPRFFANGSARFKSTVAKDLAAFGVSTWMDPLSNSSGDLSPVQFDAPSMHVIGRGIYFHTNLDTADLVPASGLEAVTRAYAKVIDDVNAMTLSDLAYTAPTSSAAKHEERQ